MKTQTQYATSKGKGFR